MFADVGQRAFRSVSGCNMGSKLEGLCEGFVALRALPQNGVKGMSASLVRLRDGCRSWVITHLMLLLSVVGDGHMACDVLFGPEALAAGVHGASQGPLGFGAMCAHVAGQMGLSAVA